MDFYNYFNHVPTTKDFQHTGINKDYYLDMMELVLEGYSLDDLNQTLAQVQHGKLEDIQSFSRVVSVVGVLLSKGRKLEYRKIWEEMMDVACREVHQEKQYLMNDFAVTEILIAYKAMKPHVGYDKQKQWLEDLRKIDPDVNYYFKLTPGESRPIHNINVFNMVGEYLRESEDLTNTEEYFDRHWPGQLDNFDENGMYIDPNSPVLYDIVTRCKIQLMFGHGYKGKYYDQLDSFLEKAGMMTLFMQSSAFELPYGGRSNQYLFNEALIAANCEYEANRHKKNGDLKIAGAFKRSARLAVQSILRWLKEVHPPRHIKNFYDIETKFGTEPYGYYDKYMITLGTFLYMAYMFADDEIEEFLCPAEIGGYVFETSPSFHKIFANSQGHHIQIDTKADLNYDSTGLGRYHRSNVPSELALSIPMVESPSYSLPDHLKKKAITIGPGWKKNDTELQFLSTLNEEVSHQFHLVHQTFDRVEFHITYTSSDMIGCQAVREEYAIDEEGVKANTSLINPDYHKIYFHLPLLHSNGKDTSQITIDETGINVLFKEYKYRISTSSHIKIQNGLYGNRNGEYSLGLSETEGNQVSLSLYLE